PAPIPEMVALSVSSVSSLPTVIPARVIVLPGSSLPVHDAVPPIVGASATAVIVTLSLALALAVLAAPASVALAVTPSVTTVPSAPAGATIARADKLAAPAVQVPAETLAAPSPVRLQPNGTPLIVTKPSVSSLSCLASLIDSAI